MPSATWPSRHEPGRGTAQRGSQVASSSAEVAAAAGGRARTTSRLPGGQLRRAGRAPGGAAGASTRLRVTTAPRPPGRRRTRPAAGDARAAPPAGRRRVQVHDQPSSRRPRATRPADGARKSARGAGGRGREHGRQAESLRATLGAAGREDRAAGAGAHPQAEAVGLGPPTVVRLERALAHAWAPGLGGAGRAARSTAGGRGARPPADAHECVAGMRQRPSDRDRPTVRSRPPAVKPSRPAPGRTNRHRRTSPAGPDATRRRPPGAVPAEDMFRGLWTNACCRTERC